MLPTSELGKLWQLQQLDLKLDELQKHLDEPHNQAEYNSTLSPARAALNQLKKNEKRLLELKKAILKGEGEIDDLESQVKETEAALFSGKGVGAKELMALERKLTLVREQYQQLEETLLESMHQYETMQADTAESKQHAAGVIAVYKKAKHNLETEVATLQDEIAAVTQQREAIASQIDPDWLTRYTKARQQHTNAIALIEGAVCGACHVHVPGGLKAQAKAGERTYCESCGRLLYVAE